MLALAARRNLKRNASRHFKYNIETPYVCSSCTRRLHTLTQSTLGQESKALEPLRRRHTRHVAIPTHSSRSLATATDTYTLTDPIPFLASINAPPTLHNGGVPFSELRQWTAGSSPLVIHSRLAETLPQAGRNRERQTFGGTFPDLLQNLHASLVVGRWDRGANIVRRLATIFKISAPELLEANRIYLNALVDAVCLQRPEVEVSKVQQWFEVDIRRRGIEPDAQMLASMCRLCFVGLEGPSRMRSLRRYLHMAEEADLLHAVMTSGDFLESEWRELVQTRDDVFSLPKEDAAKQKYIDEVVALTREPVEQYSIDQLPDVREQQQKGLGLKTLRRTLAAVEKPDTVPYPSGQEGADEAARSTWLRLRQFQMEKDVAEASVERWRTEHQDMLDKGITSGSMSKPLKAYLYQWYNQLEKEVQKEMKECEKVVDAATLPSTSTRELRERADYAPFLLTLKSSTVAAIAVNTFIEEIMKMTVSPDEAYEGNALTRGVDVTRDPRISALTAQIGKQLTAESVVLHKHKIGRNLAISSAVSKYRAQALSSKPDSEEARFTEPSVQPLNDPTALAESPTMAQFGWPVAIRAQIAAMLISKIIGLSKVSVKSTYTEKPLEETAFKYNSFHFKGRMVGILEVHPMIKAMLAKEPTPATIGARLPMLVEPTPWTGFTDGAYLLHPTRVVRMKDDDGVQEMYTRAAAEKGDLDQVFAGLNVLGQTGWKVNRKVLKVMLDAWNTGEAFGVIPSANRELDLPPPPPESAGLAAKYRWSTQCQNIKNEISGNHSIRCFYNLQLEIAHKFADDIFYLPHNIDFRGRAYPIPPYLNQMGADNARGLMLFAKGKELGEAGLKWLKVHLANLYGFDKASLREREEFTMNHLDDIIESASNPMHGKRWWLKAADPWQCLAACFEIKEALASPDPTKHISHLAVHQDGTCNGLQHYAALGGDAFGATQVNLEPGDRPSDVYTGVAELVKAEVKADAAKGEPYALALDGKITRKVVKQTVMTNVYGVTFMGARDQVRKQLDDILPTKADHGIDNTALASYIAKKIFKGLGQMFSGAQAIQFWLADCASKISTAISREQINILRNQQVDFSRHEELSHYKTEVMSKWLKSHQVKAFQAGKSVKTMFRSPVVWTTPLKLPVVQPYRNGTGQVIDTALQSIRFSKTSTKDPVLKRRQVQGFPPNFIHSLDASHMLLSALKCNEEGITFAAVHDSFWTHAADITAMSTILRDAFVRMHSENIIDRLAAEFKARYAGALYLTSVPSNSALGSQILALRTTQRSDLSKRMSRQGISSRRFIDVELLIEADRQDLLASEDAALKEQGEQLVTPASLFAQASPEDLRANSTASTATAKKPGAKPMGRPRKVQTSPANDLQAENLAEDDENDGLNAGDLIESYKANTGLASMHTDGATKTRKAPQVEFWLPLEFADVPVKGDWDVARLKNSTYFFS